MRQSGILAAGALHALDHHVQRLAMDHQHAKQLANAVRSSPHLHVMGGEPDTNIVIFQVAPQWGTAAKFAECLAQAGVRVMAFSPTSIRLVTHLDVDTRAIEVACQAIRDVASSGA